MSSPLSLADIPIGTSAQVLELSVTENNRRRLLDLGLVPGAKVSVIRRSPSGNPSAYLIKGTAIALRNEDAALILVNNIGKMEERWRKPGKE